MRGLDALQCLHFLASVDGIFQGSDKFVIIPRLGYKVGGSRLQSLDGEREDMRRLEELNSRQKSATRVVYPVYKLWDSKLKDVSNTSRKIPYLAPEAEG